MRVGFLSRFFGRQRRCRCGRDRPCLGAGEHGDVAVLLDAQFHLGADQIEAGGADMPAEKARAGQRDFGFRRAGDDDAVGIAHDDVTDAQRRAAVLVALDLRAADLHLVGAAEILLDRAGDPRRDEIHLDRAGGETPPQRPDQQGGDADRAADAIGDPAHERRADHRHETTAQTQARAPSAPPFGPVQTPHRLEPPAAASATLVSARHLRPECLATQKQPVRPCLGRADHNSRSTIALRRRFAYDGGNPAPVVAAGKLPA